MFMNQIAELTRIIIENREDGTQVTRLPNNEEMMNKINEIVRQVNQLTRTRPIPPIRPASGILTRKY
ncbi:toxin [Bacillus phage vB_BanS_Chewbecca]|uniref:Uncharacterized protein n=2 Tax=Tsamsavirus TaxID=3044849 RepID=A0AAE8YYU2_9CAUD|nr:toxin [Bacillus phage vB_BanS_Skywalker]YP_010681218.1 toxin [Bacillus phage vB_BanS_Chewbecca]UGO46158.1 hypothetical protein CHEWBECCA_75 [Bacillus phage vB_BanS_Chewbecca]UGO51342.1 hypothetical protein SKYWALKER_185 [Bacillus phage vB_BanS_Skywalker]